MIYYLDAVIHVILLIGVLKILLSIYQVESNLMEELEILRQQRTEDAQKYLEMDLNKRLSELQNKRFSHMRVVRNESEGDK